MFNVVQEGRCEDETLHNDREYKPIRTKNDGRFYTMRFIKDYRHENRKNTAYDSLFPFIINS